MEPGTVLSDLHKENQIATGTSGTRVVSEPYFQKSFSEQKYSVFVPKKAQTRAEKVKDKGEPVTNSQCGQSTFSAFFCGPRQKPAGCPFAVQTL